MPEEDRLAKSLQQMRGWLSSQLVCRYVRSPAMFHPQTQESFRLDIIASLAMRNRIQRSMP